MREVEQGRGKKLNKDVVSGKAPVSTGPYREHEFQVTPQNFPRLKAKELGFSTCWPKSIPKDINYQALLAM